MGEPPGRLAVGEGLPVGELEPGQTVESARRLALRGRSRIHGTGYDFGISRFAASLNPSEQSLKRTKAIALGFVQFRGKRGA
jgi:hypothetical protein